MVSSLRSLLSCPISYVLNEYNGYTNHQDQDRINP
jgi:hypothetical protein